jgi:hypothetical protein
MGKAGCLTGKDNLKVDIQREEFSVIEFFPWERAVAEKSGKSF